MPYNPLYTDLQKETQSLLAEYNGTAGRYNFSDAQQKNLRDSTSKNGPNTIENIYRKKISEAKKKVDFIRLRQISFIQALREDLAVDLESTNIEKRNEAERILLGAIFHRHLRLEENYNPLLNSNPKTVLRFLGAKASNIINCELNNTLVQLFDLNSLDPYTVYTCCQATWNYLQKPNCIDRYVYIQEKGTEKFFKDFLSIINRFKVRAEASAMKRHIGYIYFIVSIAEALSETDKEITSVLKKLFVHIDKGLEKLTGEKTYLTCENLINYLAEEPVYLKQIVTEFVPADLIIFKDKKVYRPDSQGQYTVGYGSYTALFPSMHITQSKFILLGAYCFCLAQCNSFHDSTFITVCKKAILPPGDNQLTAETTLYALDSLKNFMSREKTEKVNFSCWENKAHMEQALQQCLDVIQSDREKAEEHKRADFKCSV